MSKLIHFNTLDLSLINLISPINLDNKLSCEISYNNNPLMFFIDTLNVINFSPTEIILDLRNNDHIKKLFDDLDTKVISDIQSKKITKLYGLKNFTYIPLVNSFTNINGETFDILKLNINLRGDFATSLFYKYGQTVTDLNIMNEKVSVKTIVECIQVVFNKQSKFIYIDNCVRQLKVKQFRVNRVKNLEYSFIDSDDEATIERENNFKMNLDKIYEDIEVNGEVNGEVNNKKENDTTDENTENTENSEDDIDIINDNDKEKLLYTEKYTDTHTETETENINNINNINNIKIIKDNNIDIFNSREINKDEDREDKKDEDQDDDEEYTASIIKELNKMNNNSDIFDSDISESETSDEEN
jgi:hypothetical protein